MGFWQINKLSVVINFIVALFVGILFLFQHGVLSGIIFFFGYLIISVGAQYVSHRRFLSKYKAD